MVIVITLDQLLDKVRGMTLDEIYQLVVYRLSTIDIDIPDMSGLIWVFIILGGGGLLFSIGGTLISSILSIFQFILIIPIAICKVVFYPFRYFIEKKKESHTTESFFHEDQGYKFSRTEPYNPSDGLGAIPAHRSMNRSKEKSHRSTKWVTVWSKKWKRTTGELSVRRYMLNFWKWVVSSKEDNKKEKKT